MWHFLGVGRPTGGPGIPVEGQIGLLGLLLQIRLDHPGDARLVFEFLKNFTHKKLNIKGQMHTNLDSKCHHKIRIFENVDKI